METAAEVQRYAEKHGAPRCLSHNRPMMKDTRRITWYCPARARDDEDADARGYCGVKARIAEDGDYYYWTSNLPEPERNTCGECGRPMKRSRSKPYCSECYRRHPRLRREASMAARNLRRKR